MTDTRPHDSPEREAIEARAYELWLRRGCPQGSAEQDWLEAEAQLRHERLARLDATPVFDPPAPAELAPTAAAEAAEPAKRKRRSPAASASAAAITGTRVARKRPARPDA